jgi:transposase
MPTEEFSETKQAWIELKQQANFWQTQHTKAVGREKVLKAKVRELELTLGCQETQIKELRGQFNKTIDEQNIKIQELGQTVEDLKAQNAWLKQRLFGRQTEQSQDSQEKEDSDEQDHPSLPENPHAAKRPRGQQPGTPGHGRKRRSSIPAVEVVHDLKEHEKYCPVCGLSFCPFPATKDSEDIHYEMRVVRRIHKRKRYLPTCQCAVVPGIITAQAPAKLIPKGMFSVDFWVHILAEKFLFQRPMSRILQTLAMEGLDISQGTITGGLAKIKDMVYPLYTKILEKSRIANHWHMDETRWMMFVIVDGKTGYRWWLWVVVTKDTVVYLLDPSRSSQVPKDHLGDNPKGIISADRYSAYKALASKSLKLSFCWGHVRRDYVRIHDTRKRLRPWAQEWIDRINQLFHLNDQRLEVLSDKNRFQAADQLLRKALKTFRRTYLKELKSDNLHSIARKALKSLRTHWPGLLIFLDHPEIPMDNNLSERQLREPGLGRKNYYGCGSLWSGDLTAALFTIFQTARLNHIHPKQFLKAYLEASAQNQGKPPDNINDFLPWNLSDDQKSNWQYPKDPP